MTATAAGVVQRSALTDFVFREDEVCRHDEELADGLESRVHGDGAVKGLALVPVQGGLCLCLWRQLLKLEDERGQAVHLADVLLI